MVRLAFLVIILFASVGVSVRADADGTADTHIQSAFIFGKRKMWGEAIAHASAARNLVLVKYFTWQSLRDPESGADFAAIANFIDANPEWPDHLMLERRAEVALLASNPSPQALQEWFVKHPPQTSIARMRGARDQDALAGLIRAAWVNDEYSQATEDNLLVRYHAVLRTEDHVRRIDRLLWEGKTEAAKRLLKYVPADYQKLFQTRISLADNKLRAFIDDARVPGSLANDPGLLYQRIASRAHHGDRAGVRDLLLTAPALVPYPEKWWPLRDRQIREAIAENNISLAQALLARHAQKRGTVPYKEALFLSGWIELEFKKKPEAAATIFADLMDDSDTPNGKARAAYWLGRCEDALGGKGSARWYAEAARYPTTFYGQLAAAEANDNSRIVVRTEVAPTAEDKHRFEKRDLVQLVYALARARQSDLAERFIMYLVEIAETPGEVILATRLGHDIHRIDFGVRASKRALQVGIIAVDSGYPVISTGQSVVEKPLVLALSRQESEFLSDAVSGSGAVGVMQLLPGTAKETARKAGLQYAPARLFNPDYNITLGSMYIGKMIDHFHGSYVLAIASYNAGPGRVQEWIGAHGAPGRSMHNAVDWIEEIPFAETRNYVQHVMENMQVYRYVLGGRKSAPLNIAQDMVR